MDIEFLHIAYTNHPHGQYVSNGFLFTLMFIWSDYPEIKVRIFLSAPRILAIVGYSMFLYYSFANPRRL